MTKSSLTMLNLNETVKCVQCGYCLPVCPTYDTMKTESQSPRGRIHLVKLAAEGKLTGVESLAASLEKCLGCRACQEACPTDVHYGEIFESGVGYIRHHKPLKAWQRFLLKDVIPSKSTMRLLAALMWVYQASGMERLVKKGGWLRRFPPAWQGMAESLPSFPHPLTRRRQAPALTREGAYRVAYFTGCVMDAMFQSINHQAIRLLELAGCEVVRIPSETCCGALQAHAGMEETARELAARNIQAFEALHRAKPVDYIVNSIGGCGAMLVEYPERFKHDPDMKARAETFAAKVRDISQLLCRLDFPNRNQGRTLEGRRVVYQPSCHMTNVQRVKEDPRTLLGAIPGLELLSFCEADKCCGSAGIYNLIHHKEASDILDRKMDHIQQAAPDTIVTTNPGCLLLLRVGIRRQGLNNRIRAVHIVELLAEAYDLGQVVRR